VLNPLSVLVKETEKINTMVIQTPSVNTMIWNNIRNSIGEVKVMIFFKLLLRNKAPLNFYFNNIEIKKTSTMAMRIPYLNMTICITTRNSTGVLKDLKVLMVLTKEIEKINMMAMRTLFHNTMICTNTKNLTGEHERSNNE